VVGHLGYATGFLWDQGRVTVIDFTHVVPGISVQTIPCAINDAGQIAGYYRTMPPHDHGFVLNPDH
jgi:hypothetical protein